MCTLNRKSLKSISLLPQKLDFFIAGYSFIGQGISFAAPWPWICLVHSTIFYWDCTETNRHIDGTDFIASTAEREGIMINQLWMSRWRRPIHQRHGSKSRNEATLDTFHVSIKSINQNWSLHEKKCSPLSSSNSYQSDMNKIKMLCWKKLKSLVWKWPLGMQSHAKN